MGLKSTIVFVISLWVILACVPSKVTKPETKRRYLACCDPGLSAEDKAVCKWMGDNGVALAEDWRGNRYAGIWDDCDPGKEPWRKWE